MINGRKAALEEFLQFDGGVHDTLEIKAILDDLIQAGYLNTRMNVINSDRKSFGFIPSAKLGNIDVEYGIKNKATYNFLHEKFKYRLHRDKVINSLKQLGDFLLKNIVTIIVAIITSLLTTYIGLRLFGKLS